MSIQQFAIGFERTQREIILIDEPVNIVLISGLAF